MANRNRVFRRVQRLNGASSKHWHGDLGPNAKRFAKKRFAHWERQSAPYHIRNDIAEMEDNRHLDAIEAAVAAYWRERDEEDYWEAVA